MTGDIGHLERGVTNWMMMVSYNLVLRIHYGPDQSDTRNITFHLDFCGPLQFSHTTFGDRNFSTFDSSFDTFNIRSRSLHLTSKKVFPLMFGTKIKFDIAIKISQFIAL